MEYKLLQNLGSGSFSNVYLAEKDNKTVAVKIIRYGDKKNLEKSLKEVELLKEISLPKCHQALTCFYDYRYDNQYLYIEMEYIKGKTLDIFSDSYKNNPLLLYKLLYSIIYDICTGLEFLHSKGIIHRDIKPQNIIIDENNQPKLIDIGLACTTYNKQFGSSKNVTFKIEEICKIEDKHLPCCRGYAGTALYMAPETLLSDVSYFSSDIFSLGASIFKVAQGDMYYTVQKYKERMIKKRVKNIDELKDLLRDDKFRYPKLDTTNYGLNTLVNNMILKNPLHRMTTKQIMDSIKN